MVDLLLLLPLAQCHYYFTIVVLLYNSEDIATNTVVRVSTTPRNLLEFKNPPGKWKSWKSPWLPWLFTGPPGNFCVR